MWKKSGQFEEKIQLAHCLADGTSVTNPRDKTTSPRVKTVVSRLAHTKAKVCFLLGGWVGQKIVENDPQRLLKKLAGCFCSLVWVLNCQLRWAAFEPATWAVRLDFRCALLIRRPVALPLLP